MSLERLQKMAGVKPDGIFGPKTFKAASEYLEIKDPIHAVHFFAQCGHETGGFKRFEENLNYSWKELMSTWPSRYNEELARKHHRKPELIANHVYNRKSLGNVYPGDGWKFRGRGAIQLTGRANYKEMSEDFGLPMILEEPDVVALDFSFPAAMWFFSKNNIFDLCINTSDETIRKVTRKINGGYKGLDHRIELTREYEKLL